MMEDSLAEDRHSPVPGLVHRYPDRVLMLVTTQCASYCRYCTRSRIVGDPTQNFNRARPRGAARLPAPHAAGARRAHQRRRRPDARAQAARDDHPRAARDPAHRDHPHRLARAGVPARSASTTSCARCSAKYHPLWMNLHFNHPNEITPEVARAVDKLTRAGIPVGNQSVLLAGVNDCVNIQRELVHQLVEMRVRPYYLYQCDLVEGSGHFRTPVGKGLEIMEGLRGHTSRLRRADLRHRRARRRRQDPGDAQLPDQLLGPQGRAAQLRGLHHHLRGAARLQAARPGDAASRASTRAPEPGQSGVLGLLQGERMWIEPEASSRSTSAATWSRTGCKARTSGCPTASARSRADGRAALPVLKRALKPDVRPGRGAAAARR